MEPCQTWLPTRQRSCSHRNVEAQKVIHRMGRKSTPLMEICWLRAVGGEVLAAMCAASAPELVLAGQTPSFLKHSRHCRDSLNFVD